MPALPPDPFPARKPRSRVVPVRLDDDEHVIFTAYADLRGRSLSETIVRLAWEALRLRRPDLTYAHGDDPTGIIANRLREGWKPRPDAAQPKKRPAKKKGAR